MSGDFEKKARPISPLTKDINSLVSSLNQPHPKIVVQPERIPNSHPIFLCLFTARIWTIIFIIFKLVFCVIACIVILYALMTVSKFGAIVKDKVNEMDQSQGNSLKNTTDALFQWGNTLLGVTLGLVLLNIILYSLSLFGAAKEVLCLIFVWIVLLVLEIVLYVICFIIICIQFQIGAFLLVILMLVIHVFFLIVAIKFRKNVEENRSVHP